MEWKLAEAKNRFSEVYRRAMTDGPQRIHLRGETAILISEEEFVRIQGESNPLIEYLLNGPGLEDVDLAREASPMRDIDL